MPEYECEAFCECGRVWTLFLDIELSDDVTVECVVCGATVFDVRPTSEHHRAGSDTEWT